MDGKPDESRQRLAGRRVDPNEARDGIEGLLRVAAVGGHGVDGSRADREAGGPQPRRGLAHGALHRLQVPREELGHELVGRRELPELGPREPARPGVGVGRRHKQVSARDAQVRHPRRHLAVHLVGDSHQVGDDDRHLAAVELHDDGPAADPVEPPDVGPQQVGVGRLARAPDPRPAPAAAAVAGQRDTRR